MATKKKTVQEQFDAIFKRALEEAKAVQCDIEEFAKALDGWNDDISAEIEATGVGPSNDDDDDDDLDDDDLDDEEDDGADG